MSKINPFKVVDLFEKALSEFTGAPYVVTTTSCTEALFLSLVISREIFGDKVTEITIPYETYVSVPQSIIQAGYKVKFRKENWQGIYQLEPFKIYDAAKRFKRNMYINNTLMCLSFHHKKHLKIGKGGAILTDSSFIKDKLESLRYEGRQQRVPYHDDPIPFMGYNMYMTPEQAARGLTLLWDHPDDAPDQIEDPPYRDLRTFGFLK